VIPDVAEGTCMTLIYGILYICQNSKNWTKLTLAPDMTKQELVPAAKPDATPVGKNEVISSASSGKGFFSVSFFKGSNKDNKQAFQNSIQDVDSIKATKLQGNLLHTGDVKCVGLSWNGEVIFTGGSKELKAWEYPGQKALFSVTRPCQCICPTGGCLAIGSDKSLVLLNLENGEALQEVSFDAALTTITATPDGKRLLIGDAKGTIHAYEYSNGEQPKQTIVGKHGEYINALVVSKDGKFLYSATATDGTIKQWKVAEETEVQVVKAHTAAINSLAMSPEGQFLVSGGADKMIRIWNPSDFKKPKEIKGKDVILQVAVTPNGQFLFSSGMDNHVRVHKMENPKSEVHNYPFGHHHVKALVLDYINGQFFIAAAGDQETVGIYQKTTMSLTEKKVADADKDKNSLDDVAVQRIPSPIGKPDQPSKATTNGSASDAARSSSATDPTPIAVAATVEQQQSESTQQSDVVDSALSLSKETAANVEDWLNTDEKK